MPDVEVLKFGSSVLRSPRDLHVAVDEIYRRWRGGFRVLAVVSAFEGVTDELMREVAVTLGPDRSEATAAYVATGEMRTAALLQGVLSQYGLPARIVEPRELALKAEGTSLESAPTAVNRAQLLKLWDSYAILVLPGFYGIDAQDHTALFGRGGSDLSALFLAAALNCGCRLLKDVPGVFNADPARSGAALRFSALSWKTAIAVAGPLIQPKALRYAQHRGLAFEVGRPNEDAGTHVGAPRDEWAGQTRPTKAVGISLFGCGVVGRGVYEMVKRYPRRFEIRHVVVREPARYPDIEHLTADLAAFFDETVDVVMMCFGGVTLAYSLILAALNAGKYVITANKAAVASHGMALTAHARGTNRRLWYSAAVGGALPALETLSALKSPVSEIRGIINATCGVVLEAWGEGKARHDAVTLAQEQGFAETDPIRDLSGLDSADKLSLLIQAAFGDRIAPEDIRTRGIETIVGAPNGHKLIARAKRTSEGVTASVGPELPPPGSFLGSARGPENRLEIEFKTGEVLQLRGQGAGRWPTTASMMGDLHEISRLMEASKA